MALVGKNSKAIQLSLSDGISYGANTYFSPWVAPVYGALTKLAARSRQTENGLLAQA
jgi:hypothetical protein